MTDNSENGDAHTFQQPRRVYEEVDLEVTPTPTPAKFAASLSKFTYNSPTLSQKLASRIPAAGNTSSVSEHKPLPLIKPPQLKQLAEKIQSEPQLAPPTLKKIPLKPTDSKTTKLSETPSLPTTISTSPPAPTPAVQSRPSLSSSFSPPLKPQLPQLKPLALLMKKSQISSQNQSQSTTSPSSNNLPTLKPPSLKLSKSAIDLTTSSAESSPSSDGKSATTTSKSTPTTPTLSTSPTATQSESTHSSPGTASAKGSSTSGSSPSLQLTRPLSLSAPPLLKTLSLTNLKTTLSSVSSSPSPTPSPSPSSAPKSSIQLTPPLLKLRPPTLSQKPIQQKSNSQDVNSTQLDSNSQNVNSTLSDLNSHTLTPNLNNSISQTLNLLSTSVLKNPPGSGGSQNVTTEFQTRWAKEIAEKGDKLAANFGNEFPERYRGKIPFHVIDKDTFAVPLSIEKTPEACAAELYRFGFYGKYELLLIYFGLSLYSNFMAFSNFGAQQSEFYFKFCRVSDCSASVVCTRCLPTKFQTFRTGKRGQRANQTSVHNVEYFNGIPIGRVKVWSRKKGKVAHWR